MSEALQKAFLTDSAHKLYYILQFCGFASFTYEPKKGFYLKPINFFTMMVFDAFYILLIYLNINYDLTIYAKGYQGVLFYIGMHFFTYGALIYILILATLSFIGKSKIFSLFDDFLAVENEVVERFAFNFIAIIFINSIFLSILNSFMRKILKPKMKNMFFVMSCCFVCFSHLVPS